MSFEVERTESKMSNIGLGVNHDNVNFEFPNKLNDFQFLKVEPDHFGEILSHGNTNLERGACRR